MTDKRFIIPIFIPHFGCPHRCVFCNQHRIASPTSTLPSPREIRERINWFLRVGRRKRENARLVQVAFYGGNFTALPSHTQRELLDSVTPFLSERIVHSLRVSTRPDYITTQALDTLLMAGTATVELGVQSMHDEVLATSRRGHTTGDVQKAVTALHEQGLEVGIQLMIGLPGDTPDKFSATIAKTISLKPHFVRIYPTLVIKETVLERWFRKGTYQPLSLEGAVELSKKALQRFHHAQIPVIRVGLQPTSSLEQEGSVVAGPYHPAFRHLVESAIFYDRAASLLAKSRSLDTGLPLFQVSSRDISNFYGQGGQNVKRLKAVFGLPAVRVEGDPTKPRGTMNLQWESTA